MDAPSGADSRTASFRKKRHLNASNPNNNVQRSSSDGSTSRKRTKRQTRTGDQDLRDFVPLGAGFSTTAKVLEGHECIETHYISDESSEGSEGGVILSTSEAANSGQLAPAMNWNSGSKARIRTTLGGERGQPTVPPAIEKLVPQNVCSVEPMELSSTAPDKKEKHAVSHDIEKEEDQVCRGLANGGDAETNIDALMDYSQSDPAKLTENQANHNLQRPQPQTLGDLSENELRTQIRYIAITKKPEEIHLNHLVTCLICWKLGHIGNDCPALTCRICGVYDQHFTHACPRSRKCSKCREPGHVEETCPYRLPRIVANEIICDLCQQQGHIEERCEMLWRTFKPQAMERHLGRIQMACYNCGGDKHFGNDCPTRMPGKPIRSSTWSMKGLLTSGAGDSPPVMYSIKGRATQRTAAVNDGSDDESTNFYRPRLTEARRGHIKMAGKVRGIGMQGGNTRNPNGVVDSQTRRPNRYSPQPWNHDGNDSRKPESYRSRGRERSFSPQPQHPQRMGGGDDRNRWQPPLPPEPVPSRRGQGGRGYDRRNVASQGDVYRPMPSAAKSAWVKHRT